ncbi:uncharacterized protein MELLADRAFT_106257 [Melampsora larici-populina 98AG31]|uniref:Secreted protein n=1 Tax=Melampsora larici-populina (strain 98AG31 / pathotype 3-4-7) TaxID=747676 RepID=F4RKT1_MELLP|nr:uncharacterized protein MELLADRAFT_106257 [Melampsora larici-populina 98AG31]EGG06986.1 secreted protein [Melampsora larici-populina 98AG31]
MYKLNLLALLMLLVVKPSMSGFLYSYFTCEGLREHAVCVSSWSTLNKDKICSTVSGVSEAGNAGSTTGKNNAVEWTCDYLYKAGAFCCESRTHRGMPKLTTNNHLNDLIG